MKEEKKKAADRNLGECCFPEPFEECLFHVCAGALSIKRAAAICGIAPSTFRYRKQVYEKNGKIAQIKAPAHASEKVKAHLQVKPISTRAKPSRKQTAWVPPDNWDRVIDRVCSFRIGHVEAARLLQMEPAEMRRHYREETGQHLPRIFENAEWRKRAAMYAVPWR